MLHIAQNSCTHILYIKLSLDPSGEEQGEDQTGDLFLQFGEVWIVNGQPVLGMYLLLQHAGHHGSLGAALDLPRGTFGGNIRADENR